MSDATPAGFGPDRYGRSFADVYDRWYPSDELTGQAVVAIASLAPGGSVLELGVGTGRLALPLAAAGCAVTGMDASQQMLDELGAKDLGGVVTAVLGDIGAEEDWPDGEFDVVVAVFNLLLNLPNAVEQQRCIERAANAVRPGGHLVLETAVPALPHERERHLDVRHVDLSSVVLIATDTDPETGVIIGQHVELVDGQPVRLRPWRVCTCTPEVVDGWATGAGLELVERRASWDLHAPSGDDEATPIGIYRRPASDAPGTSRGPDAPLI